MTQICYDFRRFIKKNNTDYQENKICVYLLNLCYLCAKRLLIQPPTTEFGQTRRSAPTTDKRYKFRKNSVFFR